MYVPRVRCAGFRGAMAARLGGGLGAGSVLRAMAFRLSSPWGGGLGVFVPQLFEVTPPPFSVSGSPRGPRNIFASPSALYERLKERSPESGIPTPPPPNIYKEAPGWDVVLASHVQWDARGVYGSNISKIHVPSMRSTFGRIGGRDFPHFWWSQCFVPSAKLVCVRLNIFFHPAIVSGPVVLNFMST